MIGDIIFCAGIIVLGIMLLFAFGLGIAAALELADRYLFPRGDE